MTDFLSSMMKLQQDALKVQKVQLDAARKMSKAAGDSIRLQKSMTDAAGANMQAWDIGMRFWGLKK